MTWGLPGLLWDLLLHSVRKCALSKKIEQRAREDAEGEQVEVVCEECQISTFFPVAKKGSVQECS